MQLNYLPGLIAAWSLVVASSTVAAEPVKEFVVEDGEAIANTSNLKQISDQEKQIFSKNVSTDNQVEHTQQLLHAGVVTPSFVAQASEDLEKPLDDINSVQQIYDLDNDTMAQVTSVSQLSDVQPTDWAFQALQSLVERYGCIAGYPDGTY